MSFASLGALLGVTPDRAERIAGKMVRAVGSMELVVIAFAVLVHSTAAAVLRRHMGLTPLCCCSR